MCAQHPVTLLVKNRSEDDYLLVKKVAYILYCVIKTAVLTYKLVLQYVPKHFLMSSFKYIHRHCYIKKIHYTVLPLNDAT